MYICLIYVLSSLIIDEVYMKSILQYHGGGIVFGKAVNPLSVNPTKWPNTLKQIVAKLPTNCLSLFGHVVKLALKGLTNQENMLTLC